MTNSFYYYSNKIALMFINLINSVINFCFAEEDTAFLLVEEFPFSKNIFLSISLRNFMEPCMLSRRNM